MQLRKTLEAKIGRVSDDAFDFAMKELKINKRKLNMEQTLDDLTMNLEFFYARIAKDNRKAWAFMQIENGHYEGAYNTIKGGLICT